MVHYNLEHLTQDETQNVSGPIQDDEALFLFSIIRGNRIKSILEIGGLNGYSARNFIEAVKPFNGHVYTVDMNPVPQVAPNHTVITKNVLHVDTNDISEPLEMIFFDCHDMVQLTAFDMMIERGIVTDDTIIALHDTNLHYAPYQCSWGVYIPEEDGYEHQTVERRMVNIFKRRGYDVFSIRTTKDKHDDTFPFRHGVTVCQKFKKFIT